MPEITADRDYAAAMKFARNARAGGMTYDGVARALMNAGYRTRKGLTVWNVGVVYKMLVYAEASAK